MDEKDVKCQVMEWTIGKNASQSDNLMEFLKLKSQGVNNTKCFEANVIGWWCNKTTSNIARKVTTFFRKLKISFFSRKKNPKTFKHLCQNIPFFFWFFLGHYIAKIHPKKKSMYIYILWSVVEIVCDI